MKTPEIFCTPFTPITREFGRLPRNYLNLDGRNRSALEALCSILIQSQPSKLLVASSILVSRSINTETRIIDKFYRLRD
jgi:hypothetical protein